MATSKPTPLAWLAIEGRDVRGPELDSGEYPQCVSGNIGPTEVDAARNEASHKVSLCRTVHEAGCHGDAPLERRRIGVRGGVGVEYDQHSSQSLDRMLLHEDRLTTCGRSPVD